MANPAKTRRPSRGRATPPRSKAASGRYTPPVPRRVRHSPKWYPFVIVGLLVAGVVVIIGNYAAVMPGGTDYWYLVGGIAAMVVGLAMATSYR